MRTLFGSALLLISAVTLAAETQVKQQDIKGDCNVALGVNQGKVEVKCGLHEAALKPLADKLSTLQKEQKLRDKEMDALVQSGGHAIDWRWVKGHAGDPGNERADGLANKGVDKVLGRL